MTWRSLTDFTAELLPLSADEAPTSETLRLQAASLVLRQYGAAQLAQNPGLVNLCALALSLRDRLVSHVLSPGAVQLVHDTDLHALPGEAPALLQRACILEAHQPDQNRLFGDTASFGWYPLGDEIYLIGLGYPDGLFVSALRARWEERELDVGRPDNPFIHDFGSFSEWSQEAARFALVFSALLEAEGAPIRQKDNVSRPRMRRETREKPPKDWTVRHITLDRIVARSVFRKQERNVSAQDADAVDRKRPSRVQVRGHMRRQAHGTGRALRKWVYVESYEARRWIAPRPLKIIVQKEGEKRP